MAYLFPGVIAAAVSVAFSLDGQLPAPRLADTSQPSVSTPNPHALLIQVAHLLRLPPETKDVAPHPDHWPMFRDTVHSVCVNWQIVDARETRYIFTNREDYEKEMAMLRRRYQEFKTLPRVEEAERFGISRNEINDLVRFNRVYTKNIKDRAEIELDRTTALLAVAKEADYLYKIWDYLRDAKCEFYYVTVRRHALTNLRKELGEESFYSGVMPEYVVPVWRFSVLKGN